MLAYIYPIQGSGGTPENPIYNPPGIWPPPGHPGHPLPMPPPGIRPPTFPQPPINLTPPPGVWNPAYPSFPIYIPNVGWINIPLFPAQLPIIIPPALPPGVNIPGFPTNPIVIPPLPVVGVPEGMALVIVISGGDAKWGLVNKNAVVTPPIYGTTPTPKFDES